MAVTRTGQWVPKRLARLTVDQYEAMVDSGVFAKCDRFTLIKGLLVAKVPKSPRHTFVAKQKRRGVPGYGKPRVFKLGQSVPVVIEGVQVGLIAVAEILPRIGPAVGGNGA
jgi:hypothetical protein